MLAQRGIRTVSRPASACLFCQWQWQPFSTSYRRLADANNNNKPPTTTTSSSPSPSSSTAPNDAKLPSAPGLGAVPEDSPLAHAPRSYGKKLKEFTPTPLARPIGMHFPPNAGENTGIDTRSLRQRHADFTNWEKHLQRREYLKSQMARPYFRDWANLQFHEGKTFLAPPRPFRADLALFFPNLHGRTLVRGSAGKSADTTPVLEGRASVVSVFSSLWAENQTNTFTSASANPALHEVLRSHPDRAQIVRVNVEEDFLKAWLVRLFSGSLRRRVGKENWHRYFLVRKGITDEIRESIGLLNRKVGYTYLVDHECRIRWAGSGPAEEGEREGLVKGLQRVLSEMEKEGVGEGYVRKTLQMAKRHEGS